MKLERILLLVLVSTIVLAITPSPCGAQTTPSTRPYQQMSQPEQSRLVAEQAHRIAREISGTEYDFTTEFEAEIQKAVDAYAGRLGTGVDRDGNADPRLILERGQKVAPIVIRVFKARNVAPLIGLYIPFIESGYVNAPSTKLAGAVGMYQFLPKTGEHYGLRTDELLDVEKSADAAARYIAASLKRFSGDRMKEALALLAYNRGEDSVEDDVASMVNEQNRACSICALTEHRDKLDSSFQSDNFNYVARFFAAAIIGENPQAFGLKGNPLSY